MRRQRVVGIVGWSRLLAGIVLALALLGCGSPGPAPTASNAVLPPKSVAELTAGGVFPYKTYPTDSAGLAVDAKGGVHMAFASYAEAGFAAPNGPGYYAYCPAGSDCSNAANFTVVSLGTNVAEAQIKLTPQGQPRILFNVIDYAQSGYNTYAYAACDSACTGSANWKITTVATTTTVTPFIYSLAKHYFALDPQGHPRFVYDDESDADLTNPRTLHYAACDSNCTSSGSWQIHVLPVAFTSNAELALTSTGLPRVAAYIPKMNTETFETTNYLDYLACSANCGSATAQWSDTHVITEGVNADESFVLQMDRSDQPRMAVYRNSHLLYLVCNEGCEVAGGWTVSEPGLAEGDGEDPDLAFDSQNHPNISFRAATDPASVAGGLGFGVGLATCTTGCNAVNGTWQKKLVETNDTLNTAYPYTRPIGCAYSTWFGGYRSSLVLDGAGKFWIAYDAEYHYGGGAGCPTRPNEDNRAVRLTFSGG